MKRMSKSRMQSVADFYQYFSIDLEAKYFYLSQKGEAKILEIADILKILHPSVTQIAKELEKKD